MAASMSMRCCGASTRPLPRAVLVTAVAILPSGFGGGAVAGLFVVHHHHAAGARAGDDTSHRKTGNTDVGPCDGGRSAQSRSQRVAGVLDDLQSVPIRDSADGVPVRAVPCLVRDQDRAGLSVAIASIPSTSTLKVFGATSTNTGTRPARTSGATSVENVSAEVITSLPLGSSSSSMAKYSPGQLSELPPAAAPAPAADHHRSSARPSSGRNRARRDMRKLVNSERASMPRS